MPKEKSLESDDVPHPDYGKSINTNFSSGPCAKRKGWTPPSQELLGRSHRSPAGLAKINQTTDLMRKVLEIPKDYLVGIVSGSNSGSMETLLWNLLGPRAVDIFAGCVFGKSWDYDIEKELGIKDVCVFGSKFPHLCDTSGIDSSHDLVFCWTSTTSGASYHNADWISDDRTGLTICDATAAAFACDLDWSKLDATSFSWQKALGGEAGLGTIVLSPRAVERLQTYSPSWPIPRIFRIAVDRKVNFDMFNKGCLINTPSMMCIEDFCDSLEWADSIGGMPAMKRRVGANYECLKGWLNTQHNRNNDGEPKLFDFLVEESERAHHIGCLDILDKRYRRLSVADKWQFLKNMAAECAKEGSGHDFIGHAATEPHIRIWMGPTIDPEDLEAFLPRMEAACRRGL